MLAASSGTQLYRTIATDQIWTILDRLPDSDLVLRLTGMQRYELKKLEYDDEIGGAMDTRRDVVVATPWRLDPYIESEHKWLWEALEPHVEALITGAWYALPYGYAVQEVVLRRGNPITIEAVQRKPMQWFEPRRDGTLWMNLPERGHWEQVPIDGKFLLTTRLADYENPFGQALLSRCYWPWFFRHNGWEFWMKFLERFADNLLLGKVAEPQAFVDAMNALGYANVIGVGADENVSAVTQSGKDEFKAVEDALGRRIQVTWLGQTLTTQMSDNGGSYAAAQVHNLVRMDKKHADLRMVERTGQTLANLLWRVNGRTGMPPMFRVHDPQGLEAERAERDKNLADGGIVKFTAKYIVNHYDLEPDEFEIPEAVPQSPAPGSDNLPPVEQVAGTSLLAQLALRKGQRFSADQEMVETLVNAALAAADSPVPADLVMRAIKATTSPDDLLERLAKLYTGHNPVEFQSLVELSLFAVDVLGYVTAAKRIGVRDVE
jgi:phage gp29-like protein